MDSNLNLVLVEDNTDLRTLLCNVLRKDGHRVTPLSCAEDLNDRAGTEHADAFLIDINLPGEDGLSLAQRVRKAHPLVGIIILSARSELDDRLAGYDRGADLYLTKPVVMSELSAALRSFARRRIATIKELSPKTLVLNKLDLKGEIGEIKLTSQEAIVLTALARAPAGKLDTWQFADLLGVEVDESFKSSLAIRIVRIRKKMQEVGAQGNVIEALRNVGYQLMTHIEIV